MAYNGNIHRGVWAGHCFDITTRARHEQDVKEEWKDASEEVAREIASIWESEYGGDWRRIIMGEKRPRFALSFTPRLFRALSGAWSSALRA